MMEPIDTKMPGRKSRVRLAAGAFALVLAGVLAGCGGGDEGLAVQPAARAAVNVTPEEGARQLMDFGENVYPQFFPGHESTQSLAPFAFRYYESTGVYLGVVVSSGTAYPVGSVYVMGGPFGAEPKLVGAQNAFITLVDPSTEIVDSFGQIVAGGSDGVGNGDSGADGTAGDGAPIVGATVVVSDAAGHHVSAVTDTTGHYRVKVTGFTPPFVASVTKSDGSVFHSLSVTPLKTNGYVTMNITGLTDAVSSDVARAGGQSGADGLTPQIVAQHTSAIATSIANLRAAIQPVIDSSGIAADSFDPIGAAFRPNRHGYDFVLDNVVVTRAADGSTHVAVSPNFTPKLTGTWTLSINVAGAGSVPVGVVPVESIPSATDLASFDASTVGQQFVSSYQGYTITENGNSFRMTGPATDFTITINSFSFSNYVSCGSCGVGSQISYKMTSSVTEGGTLDGQSFPTSTINESLQYIYQRTN
jgi:hypothetical protein